MTEMPIAEASRARAILQLLRVRQWVKNGFVLAPLFFGSNLLNPGALIHAIAAFTAFCLMSSAVYIFNDYCDIEADRKHAKKKFRPLASGLVSVSTALSIMAALVAAACTVSVLAGFPEAFFAIIVIYVLVNVGYSLGLKQISLVELFLVSSGFVLRLLAGASALRVELSPWIVAATLMLALLLTTGKRRGDIALANDAEFKRRSLAKYNLAYLDAVLTALTGGTLVVYLLFCVSDYATERYGESVLATAVPVAFGLLRYLQLVMVGNEGDSPTDLVLSDPGMVAIVGVFVLMFAGFIYL